MLSALLSLSNVNSWLTKLSILLVHQLDRENGSFLRNDESRPILVAQQHSFNNPKIPCHPYHLELYHGFALGFAIRCSYIQYTSNEVSLAKSNHSYLLILCILTGAVGMSRFPEQIYNCDSASSSYSCYFARFSPHASTVQPLPDYIT
jgi:hypothetical protein